MQGGTVWAVGLSIGIAALAGCVTPEAEDFEIHFDGFPEERVPCPSDPEDPACQALTVQIQNGPNETLHLRGDDWTVTSASGSSYAAQRIDPDTLAANETTTVTLEFVTGEGERLDRVRYAHGGRVWTYERASVA